MVICMFTTRLDPTGIAWRAEVHIRALQAAEPAARQCGATPIAADLHLKQVTKLSHKHLGRLPVLRLLALLLIPASAKAFCTVKCDDV